MYSVSKPINNVKWSKRKPEWLALCFENTLQICRICIVSSESRKSGWSYTEEWNRVSKTQIRVIRILQTEQHHLITLPSSPLPFLYSFHTQSIHSKPSTSCHSPWYSILSLSLYTTPFWFHHTIAVFQSREWYASSSNHAKWLIWNDWIQNECGLVWRSLTQL